MAEKAPKAIMKAVPLRLPMSLYSRLEESRGEMPRERWIREAIERRLVVDPALRALDAPVRDESVRVPLARRVPMPGPNVENIVSSAQAKAGSSGPIPKGKPRPSK